MKPLPKEKCGTCGHDTPFEARSRRNKATARCTNCWEVEGRLETYLRDGGEKAEAFIRNMIKEVFGL